MLCWFCMVDVAEAAQAGASDGALQALQALDACMRACMVGKNDAMSAWLPIQASLRMDVLDGGPVEGFVGFFDVQFRGSPESPADFDVRLC
jgi:hypothetical protein